MPEIHQLLLSGRRGGNVHLRQELPEGHGGSVPAKRCQGSAHLGGEGVARQGLSAARKWLCKAGTRDLASVVEFVFLDVMIITIVYISSYVLLVTLRAL